MAGKAKIAGRNAENKSKKTKNYQIKINIQIHISRSSRRDDV